MVLDNLLPKEILANIMDGLLFSYKTGERLETATNSAGFEKLG